ncbi:MAG: sugar transferase [Patescibacteria group bacterium]
MYRFKQFTLFLGDMAGLFLGLYLAVYLRNLALTGHKLSDLLAPMTILFILAAVILFIAGLYDITKAKNNFKFFQKIIIAALSWMVIGVLYFYIRPQQNVSPKTILLLTVVIGFGIISGWRFLYNKFISTNVWQLNVTFAGITDEVKELIKFIQNEPQSGYFVVGIISRNEADKNIFPDLPFGKTIEEIKLQNQTRPINLIVLSPQLTSDEELLKNLYKSLFEQISIVSLADFYQTLMARIPPFTFSEGWFIAHLQEQQKKIYDRIKILADYLFGVIIGLFFAITYPFIVLAIKLDSKGAVFFSQKRIGRGGAQFTIYKYRTMKSLAADGSAETQGPQFAATADNRVTEVGKFLRATRLDEIPQFINILKGEMSIIGPRPERPEFVEQLTQKMPYYPLRHLIKPGLTGWAQLHRSYYGTIEENLRKLEYDLYYIKNRGFMLDLSIALHTVNTVLKMMGR